MDRLTEANWQNLDPWECCGQDNYCKRGCHEEGGCTGGCIVPRLYVRLAKYENTGFTPEQVKYMADALSAKQCIDTVPKGYKQIPKGFMDKTIANLGLDINKVDGVFFGNGGNYVITGTPDTDDENHNCDAMGCSSTSHVLYRTE